DAGKTWKNQKSPATVSMHGVHFKDAQTGWIVGDKGTIFETTDSGANWTRIDTSLTKQYLKSIDMTPDGKVFAAGYTGNIVRLGPPAPSAIQIENVTPIPEQYRLSQNYPNPFNPSTSMNYSVPKMCHVSIAIYNVTGQKIVTLVDEQKSPGDYQITWNAEKLADGIYFMKMTTKEFSAVKKLLFVK
ncbi:MAG TPA: T9SS type A sorting domain-containing protein, partial [bacterium]